MATTTLTPYISFKDTTSEAMDFYQSVFGGNLEKTTFGEYGMAGDGSEAAKVMHAQLETEAGLVFMASDTPNSMPYEKPAGVSLALTGTDGSLLRGWFDALAAGGTVVLPLDEAPWGDLFGMVADRYGVSWMVSIQLLQPA